MGRRNRMEANARMKKLEKKVRRLKAGLARMKAESTANTSRALEVIHQAIIQMRLRTRSLMLPAHDSLEASLTAALLAEFNDNTVTGREAEDETNEEQMEHLAEAKEADSK